VEPCAYPPVPRDYRTTAELDRAEIVDRFVERVDDYRATVRGCTAEQLAETIANAVGPAPRLVVPPELTPGWLEVLDGPEVVRDDGSLSSTALDAVDVVVTAAAVGIADTGTIVLDAGPGQGRRALTLVPDHHVCVLRVEQIVQTVPEALSRLDPTRPLTFISGPSATSDIELERVEGVHGPRRLDVIVASE
jgi:L-lactate dehydrogenase complex protein LldG